MNTSLPLLNVITGSQAATGSRSGNPADSFSADVPFNQVLNSQVNTRVQDNQAQARQAQQNAENQAAAKQAAANQSAAAQQSQNASANAGAASKSAAGDGSDKSSQVSDKDEDEDSTDTTTQASAELLALVANIAQNAVTPADGKAKGESSEADLLAQAKRGGKMSLADQQQALADEKQGKVDPAALQDALATARSKQDAAASELASKRNAEANPAPQPASAKDGKAAIDLGAAAKAEPKDDASALSARAQLGKAAPEVAAPAAKQDAAQATPTPVVLPAVQTVAASQPQAVFAPAYSDKIQSNVGSAGWNQALGTKITWMATAGMQSASLSLNPPDLGPMQVVLNVHNQQADATFITAQPEVKQALEAAMPKLREMMDQAGIQLGQANVQTGMPNHQQGAGSGQQQARSGSPGSFGKEQEGDVALSGTTAASATTSGLGLVDTFA
ncbi:MULTISPECIES: flagellar hook-length control protein FliK [Herbaspirillum]|uniref:Flagellar hook-length control protein n=1 Tax=Herbaspirillum aquaticum TaxID=568783 RepID=A0A225SYR7_9BURK|nr:MULTISPECIES: flagellar hook-length control protein FliK [Herbaspirillum]MRT27699.1 flagellar hook-length control protein FliK [Herbaspirillum sp. CAH-3]OWY36205.1 flagellar hook-length control protein [Herbaspirillum aquaticum]